MKRFDDELEDDRKTNSATTRKEYAKYAVMAILVLVLAVALVFLLRPKKEETLSIDPDEQTENREISVNTELPQTETGETEEPIQLLTAGTIPEKREQTIGIDVAKYQGVIDWKKVATDGIEFAMIRVGYRSLELGEIHEDEMARYNLQEASKNGIKLGVYFFSSAVTKEEAVEEADWVAELISQYPITYPVAYDCEGFDNEKNRHFCLTKEERSEIAEAFMGRIYEQGYTPMLYAAKNELADDAKWETADLEKHYRVWVSHYNTIAGTDYAGEYAMWQYTNQGTVDGISGNVDLNIAYFGYEGEEAPHSSILPEQVTANVEALMNFEEVNDTVTAKNKTNLRDKPSQGDDSTVMLQLVNGETAVYCIGGKDSEFLVRALEKIAKQQETYAKTEGCRYNGCRKSNNKAEASFLTDYFVGDTVGRVINQYGYIIFVIIIGRKTRAEHRCNLIGIVSHRCSSRIRSTAC